MFPVEQYGPSVSEPSPGIVEGSQLTSNSQQDLRPACFVAIQFWDMLQKGAQWMALVEDRKTVDSVTRLRFWRWKFNG